MAAAFGLAWAAVAIALAMLWLRSYQVADFLQLDSSRVGLGWASQAGSISVTIATYVPPAQTNISPSFDWLRTANPTFRYTAGSHTVFAIERLGIGVDAAPIGTTGYLHQLTAPFWLLTVVFSLPAAAAGWWIWRGRRATIARACRSCGYDLRASPDRCPECGTSVGIP
jgi:hypothetical protein